MDSDKTYGDIIDEMETLLNNVRAEICDYYCKFASQNRSEEEMRSLCNNCPLNRLD